MQMPAIRNRFVIGFPPGGLLRTAAGKSAALILSGNCLTIHLKYGYRRLRDTPTSSCIDAVPRLPTADTHVSPDVWPSASLVRRGQESRNEGDNKGQELSGKTLKLTFHSMRSFQGVGLPV
jgi:hypothetical protein